MGIEQDIRQTKFVNSRQKAMLNILYTYGWVIERIKNLLASEDITHQQYNILRILRGSNPQPISTLQIRERMLDKMSDTSRIVDRLVAKGLAKKVISTTDKRLVDVTITEKGQKLLKRLDDQTDHTSEIMANLDEKESEQLSNLLDKLRSSN
ncbi:MAG: MarR family winged helix-turn-helix transcriptional regulator [Candidatus Dadabacteria bacterium]